MLSKIMAALGGNFIVQLLVETLLAIFRRIEWGEIITRLAMRLIKLGLRRLSASTKTSVDDEVVEDIIKSLEKLDAPKV